MIHIKIKLYDFYLMFACVFLPFSKTDAQQRPHYTQYVLNNYMLNPALSGIENYTDVKLSFRNQWVGFPGAPQTFYASFHSPIGKDDYRTSATSFNVVGKNPRGKAYWESYTAAEPHHGIGAAIVSYKTGYISRNYATASYAYHIGLTPKFNLSAGFSGGVSTLTLDRTKVVLANPIDPAIGNLDGKLNRIHPELHAGLWIYSDRLFAGISAQQIIPVKMNLVDDKLHRSTLVPHVFATGGCRVLLNENLNFIPSVMLRYISSMPLFIDINAKLQYRDFIWLGVNSRLKEGIAGMAGINLSNTFNVSYSYDVNNARYLLGFMQRGTHEIVLGFILGNRYGDLCPKHMW